MPRRARSDSSGFVLVGVVMMVLALTILGLSLFSLSSYEAQFMNQSLDSQQALQCALGGLDRARFALAATADLGSVKQWLPRDSVVWAKATQDRPGFIGPDSTGPVSAGGRPVLIEVAASYRGVQRRLSASYQPLAEVDYYKRLFTVHDWITVNDHTGDLAHPPVIQRCGTVVLGGKIWEFNNGGASDSSIWQACAYSWTPGVQTSSLPLPDVSGFIATNHRPGDPAPTRTLSVGSPGLINYDLTGLPGKIKFWYSDTGDPNFSVYENTIIPVSLTVSGLAVWMVPRGIRFNTATAVNVVSSDPKGCLVIVAGPGIDPFTSNPSIEPGIWFFGGGLNSNIPVILVSDGQVFIEQSFNTVLSTSATKLSVFSKYLFLNGPDRNAIVQPRMILGHDNHMDATIDTLMVHRALPNSTRVSGVPYALIPGTWRSSP